MFSSKRNLLALLLCLLLVLGACAPAATKTEEAPTAAPAETPTETPAPTQEVPVVSFTAGTYTGKAMGRNNYIEVQCSFSADKLESVEVLSHNETAGMGSIPFDLMPDQIIEYQSLDVDYITGATISSAGFLNAVKECVKQAGGDAALEAMKAAPAAQIPTEAIDKTVDIVVVGGGGAGMAAALAAADQGASVILVETNGMVGGNTIVSGMGWNAANPEYSKNYESNGGQIATLQNFLAMEESDVAEYAPTLTLLKEQIKEYLAGDTSFVFDSPELHIMQFWTGCRRQGLDGTWAQGDYELVKKFCYESVGAIEWIKSFGIEFKDQLSTATGAMWQRTYSFVSKPGTFNKLYECIEELGGEIMLNTHADTLLYENGRVTGITATRKGVQPVTLHANKAVILASGGFGGNVKMADEYNNYWPGGLLNAATDQIRSAVGDGITMALAVGADTEGMGFTQLFPAVNVVTTDTGPLQGFDGINNIYINKNGERFVNEYAERDVMSAAVLEQPDGRHFQICDDTVTQARLEAGRGPSREMLDVFVERGAFYIVNSVEEMAEVIGCDAATLQKTLDDFNKAVDDSYDPLTGRTSFGEKCDTPPYYISPVMPAIHNTMGGLKINVDNAVINVDGEAIPGLFAAGEVTGGIHGGNRLGGNAVGEAFTMGRNAGLNAAK